MDHQQNDCQAALAALRESRQRFEGFIPFEQVQYIHELFDTVVEAVQKLENK